MVINGTDACYFMSMSMELTTCILQVCQLR